MGIEKAEMSRLESLLLNCFAEAKNLLEQCFHLHRIARRQANGANAVLAMEFRIVDFAVQFNRCEDIG